MPLFRHVENRLVPIRQLAAGAIYEREVEELLWDNLEDFLGEALFPVKRQAVLPSGGRLDVLALDKTGRVVIVEIKRGIDRDQLSQALEYGGWARTTSLDELAGYYFRGPESFFEDWQAFTESATPVVINRSPRIILVARDVHPRTRDALDLLLESDFPVAFVPVSVYEDSVGVRLIEVEREESSEAQGAASGSTADRVTRTHLTIGGRRITLSDLIEAGLLAAGDGLVWERPNLGQTHRATVESNGELILEDGRRFSSPSGAAVAVNEGRPADGWNAWRVTSIDNALLGELRRRLIEASGA
jgi:hypothetical protein